MFDNNCLKRTALPNQNLPSQNETIPNKKLCTTNILENSISNYKCSNNCKTYINTLECKIKNLVSQNNKLKLENEILKKEKENLENELVSVSKRNVSGDQYLRNDNNELILKNSELTIENNNLKQNLSVSNKEIFERSIENLNPNLKVIINSAIENAERPPHGKRYNNNLKTIALGTFFLSPMIYRHLKNDLDWPSTTTLHEFTKEWPNSPGLKKIS